MTFLIDLAINEWFLSSEWKEEYKWIEKRVLSSLFLHPSISLYLVGIVICNLTRELNLASKVITFSQVDVVKTLALVADWLNFCTKVLYDALYHL